MKKLLAFILALTFILGLLGCEGTSGNQEPPLTITSNGESIMPYLHFAYSGEWDGNGFIYADGTDLISELEALEANGSIPHLEYSQDFDIVLEERVTIEHILLFDEAFNQLETLWNITDLSKLDAGNYYIGIVVTEEGTYIEEANRKEYVGWACVIQLHVH